MYYLKQLQDTITLPPEYLGAHLDTLVRHQLYQQAEGRCSGAHGYTAAVLSIDAVAPARIQEGTGAASFAVRYTALLSSPAKGEVMEGTVVSVNKMGFFVAVGPVQVFVSGHLVKTGWVFDAAAVPPCYCSADDGEQRVGLGDVVRLRIVGTRHDASEIVAIGSIKEDYLGVI